MTTRLAVLGDSIAYGIGADRPTDTLAERFRTALGSRGVVVETRVFAVPGARSAGLAGQVRRAVSWRLDLAVVVIGANDLTHFVPHEQASAHLGQAVRGLVANGAEVVVAPAPDLSTVPHVPVAVRALVQAGSLRPAPCALRPAPCARPRLAPRWTREVGSPTPRRARRSPSVPTGPSSRATASTRRARATP